MKKLFAILLAVVLMATMSVPTFAAEGQTSTITVVMKDSGGDGWAEGTFGFVSLSTDELELEDYSGHVMPKGVTNVFTFESGTTDTITHTVAKDEVVYFRWIDPEDVSDEEASFNIYRDGILQYSCDDVTKFDGSSTVYELFFTSYPGQCGMNVTYTVDPTYTVTIPAAVTEGESFKVSATGVVLNTDQTLTVTLQSDFKLRNEQNIELAFEINGGDIGNDAVVLSIIGNGNKNNPLAKDSDPFTAEVAEEVKYSGTYTGTLTFTIAVNPAE